MLKTSNSYIKLWSKLTIYVNSLPVLRFLILFYPTPDSKLFNNANNEYSQHHNSVFDALMVYFYLHHDIEGARAGAIRAVEKIVEVNAVSVVLSNAWQLKPGLLPHSVSRDIHIHIGTWMQR